MRRTLIMASMAGAALALLVAVASAGPAAAKQRIQIQLIGKSSFVLTPLSPGAIKADTGTVAFCCWTTRSVVRDGQNVDLNNPQMTLTGKHGTIVTRNLIGWTDVPGGVSLFTGTWRVTSGTGSYAGLTGGGRGAGVELTNGAPRSRFQGYLHSR